MRLPLAEFVVLPDDLPRRYRVIDMWYWHASRHDPKNLCIWACRWGVASRTIAARIHVGAIIVVAGLVVVVVVVSVSISISIGIIIR